MDNEIFFNYNGFFFQCRERVISPDNRCFKYGDGFFETMKMISGNVIFEDLHFERLFSSLKILQFDTPAYFTKEYFLQKIKELVVKNHHLSSARIRLTIFRGDGNLHDDSNAPNYIIQSWALPAFTHYNEKGLSINIYKNAQKSCDIFSNIKSNNYLPYAMASVWCRKQSLDDALMLNYKLHITEATTSNVFIVKNGIIQTPALSEGCVAGVTRQYLLRCFRKENVLFQETCLTEMDIRDAGEMFLTNSGFYIQWIQQCGTKFYTNKLSKELYHRFITPLFESK